ncbi:PhnB protein [Pseudomonas granadensis]|nr:PhnB protein [Pseudomonas granadensis]
MSVKPIPEGYHSITPYLGIHKAAEAIDFYKKAFGATEVMRLAMPDGSIGHAELRIGDSAIMLGSPCDQGPLSNPEQAVSVGLHLYVADVDRSFKQALDAGATSVSEVQDQFYGDRSGTLKDPYGHLWFLATHKEDLTESKSSSGRWRCFSRVERFGVCTGAIASRLTPTPGMHFNCRSEPARDSAGKGNSKLPEHSS